MITFVICISVSSEISFDILRTQVASCLAIKHAKVFIGLNKSNSLLEESLLRIVDVRSESRVSINVLNDRSLYDGWNIAVASITSSRVVFLGYGDLVIDPDFFTEESRSLVWDIKFSRVIIHGNGKARMFGRRFRPWLHLLVQEVAIVGAVFSRELLLKKPFDADFRIVGDYDWLLQHGNALNVKFDPTVTVAMASGGLSERALELRQNELKRARKRFLWRKA